MKLLKIPTLVELDYFLRKYGWKWLQKVYGYLDEDELEFLDALNRNKISIYICITHLKITITTPNNYYGKIRRFEFNQDFIDWVNQKEVEVCDGIYSS
jgi:hypothetical protein